MRFAYFVACFTVALDCAGRAIGLSPEHLMPEAYIGVNWILAAGWMVIGVAAFWWKPEE